MINNNDYDHNLNEEVGVNISVEVLVYELPQLDDDDDYDDDDDDDDDFDMNDVPICFVAASEESIEKLEKVWVKDNPIFCSICLEDVSVGLEAAKLPCTHAYHEGCVVEWLQVSKFCPNCRVEIV
ncbi:E3 ubiquitin-protein ligase SIRP1-like [Cannabis sativa]|nr:E3 ubiquitin-protein ligase SIRP1-like [Cannabis sativa]